MDIESNKTNNFFSKITKDLHKLYSCWLTCSKIYWILNVKYLF